MAINDMISIRSNINYFLQIKTTCSWWTLNSANMNWHLSSVTPGTHEQTEERAVRNGVCKSQLTLKVHGHDVSEYKKILKLDTFLSNH